VALAGEAITLEDMVISPMYLAMTLLDSDAFASSSAFLAPIVALALASIRLSLFGDSIALILLISWSGVLVAVDGAITGFVGSCLRLAISFFILSMALLQ
jgi:hypothetical protein